MDVMLPPNVPLFQHLVRFCRRSEERGHPVRLVGGAAMLSWGRVLDGPDVPIEMTKDIDCVLLSNELRSQAEASQLAEETTEIMRSLGFSRPADWQASRKDRFSYRHESENVAIEILCGELSVGRKSRRPPAYLIASLSAGSPGFYGALVPWLDWVQEWVNVHVGCGAMSCRPSVPDLSGLAMLKIKAVADKASRVDQESDAEKLAFEERRLRRHGTHTVQIFQWIDRRGEFDRLIRLCRGREEVPAAAASIVSWLLRDRGRVERLGLERLGPALERLVTARA